jgi:hypothetical protein
MENDDDITMSEEDELEFSSRLNNDGIAAIVTDAGIIIGFTTEKIEELLQIAMANNDTTIILIRSEDSDATVDQATATDLKN